MRIFGLWGCMQYLGGVVCSGGAVDSRALARHRQDAGGICRIFGCRPISCGKSVMMTIALIAVGLAFGGRGAMRGAPCLHR